MDYSSPYEEEPEKAPTPTFGLECNACGSLNLFFNPQAFQCRACGEIEKVDKRAWALMSNIGLVRATCWELAGKDKQLMGLLKERFSIHEGLEYTPHELYCKYANMYNYLTHPINPNPNARQWIPKNEKVIPCLKLSLIKAQPWEIEP